VAKDQVDDFFEMEGRVTSGPNDPNSRARLLDRSGNIYRPDDLAKAAARGAIMMLRIGTARSGRTLDGREHLDTLGEAANV
jgi:hypothetical protein